MSRQAETTFEPVAGSRQQDSDLGWCVAQLEGHGARAVLSNVGDARPSAGGVPLRISVADLVRCRLPKGRLVDRLARLLELGLPVTLALSELGDGDEARANFESFCQCLSSRLPSPGPGHLLGLCIASQRIPLQHYLDVSTALLGAGPRYVLLEQQQMLQEADTRAETDDNWTTLWRQAGSDLPLWPAYGCSVRAPCPLLTDESSGSILPVFGLRVPADTAWLPIELALPAFTDGRGTVRMDHLRSAASACVDIGEQILDLLSWHLPRHDRDALCNRRLAVNLTGLGDVVLERGSDPRDWRCLRWLDGIVAGVHEALWECSRDLAQTGSVLPALRQNDPSTGWTCSRHRRDWQRRWRHALREHAVRHRNILVLSPYSVLPRSAEAAAEYTDLLPVLAHGDAFAFAAAPDFSGWNINEFSTFHRRAWAVMQR